MFLFFDTTQTPDNARNKQGTLFESLMKRFLAAAGFAVRLRAKKNGLEYDLDGQHTLNSWPIIGEAKAHQRPISGEVLGAFVGKLAAQRLSHETLHGYFFSTSDLTADAEDAFGRIEDGLNLRIYAGERLERKMRESLKLVGADTLRQRVQDQGWIAQAVHFLQTDQGLFFTVVVSQPSEGIPSAFIVFRDSGAVVTDLPFLRKISDGVEELKPLEPMTLEQTEPRPQEREIAFGLSVASGWDDFRNPAGPNYFVGRATFLDQIIEHVEETRSPKVLQIKARSGVGKSSVIANLHSRFEQRAFPTEVHDARFVKTVFDLFAVVHRFTGASQQASSLRMMLDQVKDFSRSRTTPSVMLVDQFESTFSNPDVFQAYELIAAQVAEANGSLTLIIARKNDLLTTFDESKISLDALNRQSAPFELKDLSLAEANILIEKISGTASKNISKEIKNYVTGFCQGFPWLIKRTMNHIVRLVNRGAQQKELFAAGLKLDELFDEELRGLDEVERTYLVRIAGMLPTSVAQLHSRFEEDPLLRKVLDKLTEMRLLRLSGDTYDTYNDVFKEYLVYQRLPTFQPSILFRLSPATVLKFLRDLPSGRAFSAGDLASGMSLSLGSVYNRIAELRKLGLLSRESDDQWHLPQDVVDSLDRGTLNQLLRQRLTSNALVADLVEIVRRDGSLPVDAVSSHLQERFPFIDANDRTWGLYAGIVVRWVTDLRLLDREDDVLRPSEADRATVTRELGNLTHLTGRSRRANPTTVFLPSAFWSKVESAVARLASGETVQEVRKNKAVYDLRALSLVKDDEFAVDSLEQVRRVARETLSQEPYTSIWKGYAEQRPLRESISDLIGPEYSVGTLKWRAKLLINWGRALGLISDEHRRYQYWL